MSAASHSHLPKNQGNLSYDPARGCIGPIRRYTLIWRIFRLLSGKMYRASTQSTLIDHIAPADTRAEVAAAFYVVNYIGVALPVLGVGFGAGAVALLKNGDSLVCGVFFLCLVG